MIGFNGGLIGGFRDTAGLASVPGVWTANEQVVAQRSRRWIELPDPFFSSVSLLLPANGANGSTTFTDFSNDKRIITATGTAQISTSQSRWGGSSAFFNGTSDALTFDDPQLGTGNFTIEMWVKTNSSVHYAQLIGNEASGIGYSFLINNNGPTGGQLAFWPAGTLVASSSSGDWSDDNWHHIALTRLNNLFTIWVDGINLGSGTSTVNLTGTIPMYVGRNPLNSPRNLVGYIDDLRITKGVARYTSNFTPPTAPHPLF